MSRKNRRRLVDLRPHDPVDLLNNPVRAWVSHDEGLTFKILRREEVGRFWVLQSATEASELRLIPKSSEDFPVFPVVGAVQGVNSWAQ